MSCQKIRAKLKQKGLEVKELYASNCAYGGGYSYFLVLAPDTETALLEIDGNCEIETQFDSKEDVFEWIEQLPSLKELK